MSTRAAATTELADLSKDGAPFRAPRAPRPETLDGVAQELEEVERGHLPN
jgi:hypothetical protein